MARKTREERGREWASRANGTAGAANGGGAADGPNGVLQSSKAKEARAAVCTALSYLFMRDDGWLRATATEDGKSIYFKWKFTRGEWSNHYVMTLVEVWQWDYGVILLLDKLEAVDLKVKRPTRDRPFEHPEWEAYSKHTLEP